MSKSRRRTPTVEITIKSMTPAYKKILTANLSRAVHDGALVVQRTTKETLEPTGKTSPVRDPSIPRLYWNATERKYTQASEPGTPPHKQRGELRARIAIEPSGPALQAKIGPRDKLVYGRAQELGTDKLPPRPYLKPSFLKARQMVLKLIRHAIKKSEQVK